MIALYDNASHPDCVHITTLRKASVHSKIDVNFAGTDNAETVGLIQVGSPGGGCNYRKRLSGDTAEIKQTVISDINEKLRNILKVVIGLETVVDLTANGFSLHETVPDNSNSNA